MSPSTPPPLSVAFVGRDGAPSPSKLSRLRAAEIQVATLRPRRRAFSEGAATAALATAIITATPTAGELYDFLGVESSIDHAALRKLYVAHIDAKWSASISSSSHSDSDADSPSPNRLLSHPSSPSRSSLGSGSGRVHSRAARIAEHPLVDLRERVLCLLLDRETRRVYDDSLDPPPGQPAGVLNGHARQVSAPPVLSVLTASAAPPSCENEGGSGRLPTWRADLVEFGGYDGAGGYGDGESPPLSAGSEAFLSAKENSTSAVSEVPEAEEDSDSVMAPPLVATFGLMGRQSNFRNNGASFSLNGGISSTPLISPKPAISPTSTTSLTTPLSTYHEAPSFTSPTASTIDPLPPANLVNTAPVISDPNSDTDEGIWRTFASLTPTSPVPPGFPDLVGAGAIAQARRGRTPVSPVFPPTPPPPPPAVAVPPRPPRDARRSIVSYTPSADHPFVRPQPPPTTATLQLPSSKGRLSSTLPRPSTTLADQVGPSTMATTTLSLSVLQPRPDKRIRRKPPPSLTPSLSQVEEAERSARLLGIDGWQGIQASAIEQLRLLHEQVQAQAAQPSKPAQPQPNRTLPAETPGRRRGDSDVPLCAWHAIRRKKPFVGTTISAPFEFEHLNAPVESASAHSHGSSHRKGLRPPPRQQWGAQNNTIAAGPQNRMAGGLVVAGPLGTIGNENIPLLTMPTTNGDRVGDEAPTSAVHKQVFGEEKVPPKHKSRADALGLALNLSKVSANVAMNRAERGHGRGCSASASTSTSTSALLVVQHTSVTLTRASGTKVLSSLPASRDTSVMPTVVGGSALPALLVSQPLAATSGPAVPPKSSGRRMSLPAPSRLSPTLSRTTTHSDNSADPLLPFLTDTAPMAMGSEGRVKRLLRLGRRHSSASTPSLVHPAPPNTPGMSTRTVDAQCLTSSLVRTLSNRSQTYTPYSHTGVALKRERMPKPKPKPEPKHKSKASFWTQLRAASPLWVPKPRGQLVPARRGHALI